jgi:hypothetical protein
LPLSLKNKINAQFIPVVHPDDTDAPAFDLIRASVNLTYGKYADSIGYIIQITTYQLRMLPLW